MPIFKLLQALPQSAPGNKEYHYGYLCEVREDGVYIDLADEATISNFVLGRRITKHAESPSPAATTAVEPVVEEVELPKDTTAEDVIENGTGKRRGRPPKSESNGLAEALGE